MNGEVLTNAIGTAAALFSISSFVFQIQKIMATKDASAVSLKTYAFTVTCFVLWVIYGIRLEAWPITGANAAALVLCSTVLFLKWKYRDNHPAEGGG